MLQDDNSTLSDDKLQQMLITWNDTQQEYAEEGTIHELFEIQVAHSPHALALVSQEGQLTYQELNNRANQLAAYLQKLGVGPESIVGLFMERSIDMVVALLGILKAGGAYLPLDPEYPRQRIGFIIEDAQPAIILTHSGWVDHMPTNTCHILCLDNAHCLNDESTRNPVSCVTLDHLAYVIYTSGSTGQPKGVLSIHQGLRNRILWMQQAYRIGSTDRILQKTPFSFDVSVWEFFWPLITGARLVLAKPGGQKDSYYLIEIIKKQEITTLHFVPSMLRIFLEADTLEQCHSLRRVFCSGEVLTIDLQKKFFERLNAALYNLYGPTEASIDVTHWTCERISDRRSVPIGRPIANTQIYILDKNLHPVPPAVPGELHIGGYGLARGYQGRPELTAQRFIRNPFDPSGETYIYKTGDLAYYQEDGIIEFLGRIDHQVKIRGFRIELLEIEAVLDAHPAVRKSIILIYETETSGKSIVACIIAEENASPTRADLLDYLRHRLPPFMLPAYFAFFSTFPLTTSGKIDRPALLESFQRQLEALVPVADFQTPTQRQLAGIWGNVLLQGPTGPADNFFELGGNSLLAIQVIARIRNVFQVHLPIHIAFEHPTLSDFAAIIEAAAVQNQHQAIFHMENIDRGQNLALSYAQQRLWFLSQLEPSSSSYTVMDVLHIRGQVDSALLEHCLRVVVSRHESLRTTFELTDEGPIQIIAPIQPQHYQLTQMVQPNQPTAIRMLKEEARKPFDLEQGPLLRTYLLQIGTGEYILGISMHHIITDGWSLRIFHEELTQLWNATVHGTQSVLPALPIQYVDYAYWQRRWLEGEMGRMQLAYWRKQLADAPRELKLPTDYPHPNRLGQEAGVYYFFPSASLASRLVHFCRHEQVTPFMALYTIFAMLLSRYSGQEDIVVGIPVAGRNFIEVEPLIGFFVNTLALRTDLSGNPSFRILLQRVRNLAATAYTHQDFPFEQLVADLQPGRSPHRLPLFQVFFNFQEVLRPSPPFSGLQVERLTVENQITKFDLKLDIVQSSAAFTCSIEYSKELFLEERMVVMATHYCTLLEQVIDNPEKKIFAYALNRTSKSIS
jgi:amino acid adenylation domain-containing protein